MNEVKMSSWVIFWFSATPNIEEAAFGNLFWHNGVLMMCCLSMYRRNLYNIMLSNGCVCGIKPIPR
jgi:hypothetical protein